MAIYLRDIWRIPDLHDYKIHFARWNGESQPLEVWVRSQREWQGWQEYRPRRDEFNRPLIFALVQFYHETDIWLFGGIFKVIARHSDRYEVTLSADGAEFVGRLKMRTPYRGRQTRARLERHYDGLEVQEILREPYGGRTFPGFDNIDLSFEELEALIRNDREDWKAALESIRGIYIITDTKVGRRYVGSAYGEQGVWSRLRDYVQSGHGGNVELRQLAGEVDLEYCRSNFRFALLEHRLSNTPAETILQREAFWKRILLTRGKQGLNRN